MNYETATMKEIMEQPRCWEKTVELAHRKAKDIKSAFSGVEEVIFTGCGSAYNVSWVAAPTFQYFTGIKARAFPAAEIFQYPDTVFTKGTHYMVIPISRSGETTETVKAMQYALGQKIETLSITCFPQSPLAIHCKNTLLLEWTQEKSVVTTQSLTSMVLMTQLLSGIVSDRVDYFNQLKQLPLYGKKILASYQALGKEIGEKEEIEKFAFVGSGPYYGLAREAQLKIKEMTLLPSDSYPVLEYRHGPRSNVDSRMLVTILASDAGKEHVILLVKEIKSLGGKSLLICDEVDPALKGLVDYFCVLKSGLSEFARGILYMPVIHLIAYHKALKRELDPDNPKNVSYWVKS
jgi:glucosamine--fructose-6-phosphate aminotransferase (isomerizing)